MTIGGRLKEIREERLHINQSQLAELGGCKKSAITQWEKGEGYPDALFLKLISNNADVLYIINGKSSPHTDAEHELLANYRDCSEEDAQAIRDMAKMGKKKTDDNNIDLEII